MLNKRGLSDLVSNVLVILLVFVSIAIMGVIILNLVNLSKEGIEDAVACKQINVRPVQCIHNNSDANLLFATEYESGITLESVDAISLFSDGTSSKQTILGEQLGNFETQSVRESEGDNKYDKFYTVAHFRDDKGMDRVCTSDTVDCTLYNNPNINIISPIVNPAICGSAAKDYSSTANSYSGEFCTAGSTLDATPSFPSIGSSASWKCDTSTCTARRLSPTEQVSGGGGGGGGGNNPIPAPSVTNGICGNDVNKCSIGTLKDIADNVTDYLWQCLGSNSGSSSDDVTCNAKIGSERKIFSCQVLNVTNGVYVLTENLIASNSSLIYYGSSDYYRACLIVDAENVTIDGKGYSLIGPSGVLSYPNNLGIGTAIFASHLNAPLYGIGNLTVRNLVITSFNTGISMQMKDVKFYNNTLTNNYQAILPISRNNNGMFYNNVITNNLYGFFGVGVGSDVQFNNNTVCDNQFQDVYCSATIYHLIGSGNQINTTTFCTSTLSYVPCGSQKQNGVCGSNFNQCSAGTLNDIADNVTDYLWQCLGISGGNNASCSTFGYPNYMFNLTRSCTTYTYSTNTYCSAGSPPTCITNEFMTPTSSMPIGNYTSSGTTNMKFVNGTTYLYSDFAQQGSFPSPSYLGWTNLSCMLGN